MNQADGPATDLRNSEATQENACAVDTARFAFSPVRPRQPAARRNACPSLSAPMVTGDGLLARFRPMDPRLTIAQFRALSAAATRCGNGILEVTARGSLQIRGLRPDTVETLNADLAAAGIAPATGVTIEVPPLAGIDPSEISDAREMAARLRVAIAARVPGHTLAPKLAIIVDGGGRFNLSQIAADIRLTALDGQSSLWALSIAGPERAARQLARLTSEHAVNAVVSLLGLFADLGPSTRGRDVPESHVRHLFGDLTRPAVTSKAALSPAGLHELGEAGRVLGMRLAYGQVHSADLDAFLDAAEACGASEVRTAPEYSLFVLGFDRDAALRLKAAADRAGFRTEAGHPANHIAVCAGAGACASAYYATKPLADLILPDAPELLDGSLTLHLSGCPKGCAHPGTAGIALVGAPIGYGLVVNGSASSEPQAYIDRDNANKALEGLARLVRSNKHAGESANACLTRLGAQAIVKAIRQG